MFLKSLQACIPEPLMVRHPVPYGPELRRDEAIAAFSTMPLLGHEAGIEQDAEVLRDGRPADGEAAGEVAHRPGPLAEGLEHGPPRRIAECLYRISVSHNLP